MYIKVNGVWLVWTNWSLWTIVDDIYQSEWSLAGMDKLVTLDNSRYYIYQGEWSLAGIDKLVTLDNSR